MKKILLASLAVVSLGISAAQANPQKCADKEFVLQRLEEGKLSDGNWVVPERRYEFEIVKSSQDALTLSSEDITSTLNSMSADTIQKTAWHDDFCEIYLISPHGPMVIRLYPYKYQEPSKT